mmetsp:Transcript_13819/g.45632  ORF Transcript_13819/g.45632 Transcript_13819/m.45632 type:complete len:203 (+) Transcript_13819:240-848(+)
MAAAFPRPTAAATLRGAAPRLAPSCSSPRVRSAGCAPATRRWRKASRRLFCSRRAGCAEPTSRAPTPPTLPLCSPRSGRRCSLPSCSSSACQRPHRPRRRRGSKAALRACCPSGRGRAAHGCLWLRTGCSRPRGRLAPTAAVSWRRRRWSLSSARPSLGSSSTRASFSRRCVGCRARGGSAASCRSTRSPRRLGATLSSPRR